MLSSKQSKSRDYTPKDLYSIIKAQSLNTPHRSLGLSELVQLLYSDDRHVRKYALVLLIGLIKSPSIDKSNIAKVKEFYQLGDYLILQVNSNKIMQHQSHQSSFIKWVKHSQMNKRTETKEGIFYYIGKTNEHVKFTSFERLLEYSLQSELGWIPDIIDTQVWMLNQNIIAAREENQPSSYIDKSSNFIRESRNRRSTVEELVGYSKDYREKNSIFSFKSQSRQVTHDFNSSLTKASNKNIKPLYTRLESKQGTSIIGVRRLKKKHTATNSWPTPTRSLHSKKKVSLIPAPKSFILKTLPGPSCVFRRSNALDLAPEQMAHGDSNKVILQARTPGARRTRASSDTMWKRKRVENELRRFKEPKLRTGVKKT